MLNGIHIVDFGNHRDTELRFGAFTALVGQNGAGKTNVMRAIMELSKAVNSKTFENANLKTLGRAGTKGAKLAAGWPLDYGDFGGDSGVEIRNGPNSWYWRARAAKGEIPWIPPFRADLPIGEPHFRRRAIEFGEPLDSEPGKITEIFEDPKWSSSYFKLLGERLKGPSYTEVNPPLLSEDGAEFAWTLAYLMTAKPECFKEIMEALRDIVPLVKNVRARPVRVARIERKTVTIQNQKGTFNEEQTVMGQELIFDMVSGEGLPANFVSDGTLVVLAILTAIIHRNSESDRSKMGLDISDTKDVMTPTQGYSNTILLDDIEQGLHPSAQRTLIRQLRKLQQVRPELQLIVSSHSPYVVDELSPEDVWLFAPDKGGCAAYARLSDHPDVDKALKVLTTGEFWSSEGEEWVLDPEKRTGQRKKKSAA